MLTLILIHIFNSLMHFRQDGMRVRKVLIGKQLHIIHRIQRIKNPNLTSKLLRRVIHRHTSQCFICVIIIIINDPVCDIDTV